MHCFEPLRKIKIKDEICKYDINFFQYFEKYVESDKLWWSDNSCLLAAEKCHINVLEWAVKNGAPWKDDLYRNIFLSGNRLVLEWIQKNMPEKVHEVVVNDAWW